MHSCLLDFLFHLICELLCIYYLF